MLDRMQTLGHVQHVENQGPYDKGGVQFTAMKRADRLNIVRIADCVLTLDADEFVNIHVGDGTMGALLAALPEATAITLTWRLFGNAGVRAFRDENILHTFTKCAPEVMQWP